MKCSKCGFNNPPDALYCEECDWRLDQVYRAPKKRNPMSLSAVSLVIGIAAAVLMVIDDTGLYPLIAGLVGLLIGSYSLNIPRYIETDNKNLCMAMAAIGIFGSVIGFVLGFATYLG